MPENSASEAILQAPAKDPQHENVDPASVLSPSRTEAEGPVENPREARVFEGRVPSLDVLRGFAALLIFTFHFFVFNPLPAASVDDSLRQAVLNFFGMGVPLFYTLSGISLYIGFFENRNQAGFLEDFYRRRIFRIAPLFYFATAIWIAISFSRGAAFDALKLITTLSFAFNLIPGLHESYVAAGWSVGVEMVFYAVFPLVVVCARSLFSAVVFWVACVLLSLYGHEALERLLAEQHYANLAFVSHLGYFATGILIYFLGRGVTLERRRTIRFAVQTGIVLLLLFGSLYLLTGGLARFLEIRPNPSVSRLLWIAPIGLLVVSAYRLPVNEKWLRPLVALGNWSYSLYLLHPIVLYFVFEQVRASQSVSVASPIRFWLLYAASALSLFVVAFLTFQFLERPFMRYARDRVWTIGLWS